MATNTPLDVITFNVRAYPAMRARFVREDLQYARKQDADLYAWQEFWLQRYRNALRNQFWKPKWGNFAPDGPLSISGTCLSFKKERFKLFRGGQFKMHGVVPFVCSVRYARWLRLWDRDSEQVVTFISAHPTPSAFSNRLSGYRKRKAREAWELGMRRLRDFAEAEARKGRLVIIGMDANASAANVKRVFGDKLGGQRVRVRTSKHGWKIDHIIIIGGGTILGYWTGKDADVHSDHMPYRVRFRPL